MRNPDSSDAADLRTADPSMEPGGTPGKEWPEEVGGPKGPEPTRFGDWEKNGRCSDF